MPLREQSRINGAPVCPRGFDWCGVAPCDNARCEELHDHRCSGCQFVRRADAIKVAVAPHVCRCSNGPCPKCGGTGPEGEWFEGSEVECADCGAPLIVATAEPCHGSSTFEAIDEEPDEEDDESGEDAPGAVGK